MPVPPGPGWAGWALRRGCPTQGTGYTLCVQPQHQGCTWVHSAGHLGARLAQSVPRDHWWVFLVTSPQPESSQCRGLGVTSTLPSLGKLPGFSSLSGTREASQRLRCTAVVACVYLKVGTEPAGPAQCLSGADMLGQPTARTLKRLFFP